MAVDNRVNRRVYFFRSVFQNPDMKLNSLVTVPDTVVGQLFDHIGSRDFVQGSPNTRYLKNRDGDDFVMFVDSVDVDHVRGRMAVARRSNFPSLEKAGVVKNLTVPEGTGLVETSHFVLFRKRRILGMEFNFYGPRAATMAYYLQELGKSVVTHTDFEPFALPDVFQTVKKISEVRGLSMTVHRDRRGVINALNEDLGKGLDSLAGVSNGEMLQVSIGTVKRKGSIGLPFGMGRLAEFLSGLQNREAFNHLYVKGVEKISGKVATFDLLEDRLVSVKRVLKEDRLSRTVQSESMYDAIEEAFKEIGPNLPKG